MKPSKTFQDTLLQLANPERKNFNILPEEQNLFLAFLAYSYATVPLRYDSIVQLTPDPEILPSLEKHAKENNIFLLANRPQPYDRTTNDFQFSKTVQEYARSLLRELYTRVKQEGFTYISEEAAIGDIIADDFQALLESKEKIQIVKIPSEKINEATSLVKKGISKIFETEPAEVSKDEKLAFFLQPINKSGMSIRLQNGLRARGYKYLGEVLNISPAEFLRFNNLGRTSLKKLNEIIEALEKNKPANVPKLELGMKIEQCILDAMKEQKSQN